MEEIITKISTWAAPPLLGAVIYFVVKKFDDIEKSVDSVKKNIDYHKRSTEDKFDRSDDRLSHQMQTVREDLNRNNQLIVQVQTTMSKEIAEMGKVVTEMKVNNAEVRKWLEDSRIHHGRIIHLDASVQRHEQILVSSAKVMKNQNDRLSRVEGTVINLNKKKKEDDEGA